MINKIPNLLTKLLQYWHR